MVVGGFLCLMILGRIPRFKFDWVKEDVIKFLTLSEFGGKKKKKKMRD